MELAEHEQPLFVSAPPETRHKAGRAVAAAVKSGVLVRGPCRDCGKTPADGHHHKGYAPEHWLDVIWLCRRCHLAEHYRIDPTRRHKYGSKYGGGREHTETRPPINLEQVLADAERDIIRTAVVASGGNLSATAKRLAITRPKLYRRMAALFTPEQLAAMGPPKETSK